MNKKTALIIGIVLIIIGIFAFDYAEGVIDAYQNRYTWTSPYSGFEARIIMTKYFGVGSLIMGIADIITVYIPKMLKETLNSKGE